MANKKYRVLLAGFIGSIAYQPNDVVSMPESLGKAHADSLDGHKDAVAYALGINGNQVKEHKDQAADREAKAIEQREAEALVERKALADALRDEIAQLEADLAAVDEGVSAEIAALLEEKRAALVAL